MFNRLFRKNKEYVVVARWDGEAGVWVATSEDVPGLVTEAKTPEELLENLRSLVPDLLELNNTHLSKHIPLELLYERKETLHFA